MRAAVIGLAVVALGAAACVGRGGGGPRAATTEPLAGRAVARLLLGDLALLPAAAVGVAAAPLASPHVHGAGSGAAPTLPAGRSYSIGTASRGYLVGARALPRGDPALRPRPSALRKDAIYGTDELVGALTWAAHRVASRWPGSVVYAGDLSLRHGGPIAGHASHRSGRDADVAFFMRDDAGRMADSPRMLPVGADGVCRWDRGLRFDVARNWAFVEALVRDPKVQLQYVFVANHLRALLLAHARARGVDAEVLRHAAAVLRQPRDSSIHEEHFHVRLYCALEERVAGCVDYGVFHRWTDRYDEALARRVAEVLPLLRAGAPAEARYAITRIVRLRVTAAVEHIEPLTRAADPSVAALARDAVAFLRGERTPPRWAFLTEEDPGD